MPKYIGYRPTGTANSSVTRLGVGPSITSLLLTLNGTNGATSTVDEAGSHTITFNGNAQLSTGQKKFGTASLLLDGSGDYLDVSHDSKFNLTGDFTIECWIRTSSLDGNGIIVDLNRISTNPTGFGFYRNGSSILWYASSNGSTYNIANGSAVGTLSVDTWYHIAVAKKGSSWAAWLNGTRGSTVTSASTPFYNVSALTKIGAYAGGLEFQGYIDDVRIINGLAIYDPASASITVPAAELGIVLSNIVERKYNSGIWSISNSSGSDYSVYAKRSTSLWPTTSRNNAVVEAPLYAHYVRWDSSEASKINVGSGTWVSSDSGSLAAITLQHMNGSFVSQAITYSASTQNGRNVINSPVNRLFRITSGSDATSRSNYSIMMVFSTGTSSRVPLLFGGNRGFELNGNGGTSANRIDFIGGSGDDRTITQTGIGSSYNIRRVFGVSYDGTAGLHSALAYSSLSGGITLGTSGGNGTGGSSFAGGSAFELGGYSGAGPTITLDDFDFCELIFYSSTLTQPQLDAEGARLKNKWNT